MKKIGFISGLGKATNLKSHGGQEVWASLFLLEHAKRDYLFDFYSVKNSIHSPPQINLIEILDTTLDEVRNNPIIESHDPNLDLAKIRASVYTKAAILLHKNIGNYDFIIESTGQMSFIYSWDQFDIPLIVIGHFPVTNNYVRMFKVFPLPSNIMYVFPSKYQYDAASWIPQRNKSVIPHGIDIQPINFHDDNKNNNIVWLGRIDPTMPKGIIESIKVSNTTKHPLQIYGYIEDKKYFEDQIKPYFSEMTSFIGSHNDKNQIFEHAKLFLFPIQWEEPFGLVMIEAMASGTPVIAFARGSVPEIVADGETGFIVNSSPDDVRGDWIIKKTGIEGLCEAVERIYSMPSDEYSRIRRACRERVEKYFTVEKMVNQYENLYKTFINR